jgi:exodeoxyribonuclease-3
MKIASWNINSVRVRIAQLSNFLQSMDIDVCLLQETKCIDEAFPVEHLENIGYNVCTFGQKSYNGVAIVSKYMIEEVITWNDVEGLDPYHQQRAEARYIEALINNYTIASVYVPNGVAPGTPNYSQKLSFLLRLMDHLAKYDNNKLIVGGDFNVALTDYDVYDPKGWYERICCTELERIHMRNFIDKLNLVDVVRQKHSNEQKIYTWWSYRTGSYKSNKGLRLDYIFSSQDIAIREAYVADEMMTLERPSDHAPVVVSTHSTREKSTEKADQCRLLN